MNTQEKIILNIHNTLNLLDEIPLDLSNEWLSVVESDLCVYEDALITKSYGLVSGMNELGYRAKYEDSTSIYYGAENEDFSDLYEKLEVEVVDKGTFLSLCQDQYESYPDTYGEFVKVSEEVADNSIIVKNCITGLNDAIKDIPSISHLHNKEIGQVRKEIAKVVEVINLKEDLTKGLGNKNAQQSKKMKL